ncbi:PstS family phosphate ABC transporter substrate-binding protein [Pseudomethylobacillus aquaticus]|uniref:Phosphate-binding protein n=1 Tax=Pseudomethylobacillus aquaticus TaxID=2676064 RepID=A0A3N0V5Z9_9PROT|nr:PstS family phosphate ABC transporter substrate-binding protein [Pseudomethylobacillus aquaticus]ROH88095.1 PstS family phosphate ABC transporter substrate-binding protein [Pseudomethylobacillus aquaticus]
MQSKFVMSMSVAAFVAAAFAAPVSHAAPEKIIKVDGSSTVYPITEAVAEEYQKATKTKVTVGISGTGGGFKKFCRGETDISNASRPILQKEIDDCKANGVQFIELPIAFDALTVVINPKNEFAKTLSVAELKKMWEPAAQGKVKTWKQVNPAWPDQPLKLFGAGADSGTFDYFTEAIVGKAKSSRGDFTASEDDNVLVNGVAGDVNAIGYFGYAYYDENKDKLRAAAIVEKAGSPAVLPSRESIENGTYQPLGRPIFIYVNATAAAFKPHVKGFVDYYLTKSKPLIEEVKYVPLPQKDQDAVIKHWKELKPGTGFGGVAEVGVKVEDLLSRIK